SVIRFDRARTNGHPRRPADCCECPAKCINDYRHYRTRIQRNDPVPQYPPREQDMFAGLLQNPIQTMGNFAREYLMVVLGVLTALGLGQWVVQVKQDQDAAT